MGARRATVPRMILGEGLRISRGRRGDRHCRFSRVDAVDPKFIVRGQSRRFRHVERRAVALDQDYGARLLCASPKSQRLDPMRALRCE